MFRWVISKKLLKVIFFISLVMHFSYALIPSLGVFKDYYSFLIFNRSRVITDTLFAFGLLVTLIFWFSKFMYVVEVNSFNQSSIKWMIQKNNLILFSKLILMTIPFVIMQLINFFTHYALNPNSAFDIIVLTYASFTLILLIATVLMFVVWKFILSKSVIKTHEQNVDFLLWSLYFESVFLDIENFDLTTQTIIFENEVDNFLVSTNVETEIKTQIIFSDILANAKKANTPPLV